MPTCAASVCGSRPMQEGGRLNGTTSYYLKLKNMKIARVKNQIIKFFIRNGNATNNDLAKEFALSVPTVSKIISEMMDEGFVNEYGKLETGEGRHPNLYGLNPDSAYFVGVDMMPDTVSMVLMNFRGDLVELSMDVPLKVENTEESLDALCGKVVEFINGLSVDKSKIGAVNLNISGRVNPFTGYSFSMFNFSEAPLTELLSEKIGCPVYIDNDSRAMAYGEYMKCDHSLVRNMLFINLSWGLGMGIIVNGKVYRGKSGYSGELGHVHAFDNEILCHCGKKGCLETQVSGRAFHRLVMECLWSGVAATRTIHGMAPFPLMRKGITSCLAAGISYRAGWRRMALSTRRPQRKISRFPSEGADGNDGQNDHGNQYTCGEFRYFLWGKKELLFRRYS